MLERNRNRCRVGMLAGMAVLATLTLVHSAIAQLPYQRHSLVHGNMPPGLAAESYRLSDPQGLTYYVQPVRIVVPEGGLISVRTGQGQTRLAPEVTVGMQIGPVYRLQVSQIPGHPNQALYPSIEILNKLHPPRGLESEFPIEVVITKDDLEQAIEGRMVTKVIYLEDPEIALPRRHQRNHQPYFDVGGREDPLRAAERLGRPMAILRIGSRIPLQGDPGFGFQNTTSVVVSSRPRITPPPIKTLR